MDIIVTIHKDINRNAHDNRAYWLAGRFGTKYKWASDWELHASKKYHIGTFDPHGDCGIPTVDYHFHEEDSEIAMEFKLRYP